MLWDFLYMAETLPIVSSQEESQKGAESSIVEFEYRLIPFMDQQSPLFLKITTEEAAKQFRDAKKIATLDSEAYKRAYEEERGTPKHSILVVGLGKGGDATSSRFESFKAKPQTEKTPHVHCVVIEREQIHGGRAGFTIDKLAHGDRQTNAIEKGAIAYANPNVDALYEVTISHAEVQEFAKTMGCVAVVWVGGGEENELAGVDYAVAQRGMDFINQINLPLSTGESTLRQLAHMVDYNVDKGTGVPLPTYIQGGGRVGEDVIIKDVAMRIALALERKAYKNFGAQGQEKELSRALAVIDAMDFGKIFKSDTGLHAQLKALGLTPKDIGETVLQYHDAKEVMKLEPVKPEDIDTEIIRREKENQQLHENKLPIDRRSVEKYLRSQQSLSDKVVAELEKWQKKFGIKLSEYRSVRKVEKDAANAVWITPIDTKESQDLEEIEIGLLVTAIGFHGVDQIEGGDPPVFYAGMAATGDGNLGATIRNVNAVIDQQIVPYLKSLEPPTQKIYQGVLSEVQRVRENSGVTITDPVERTFAYAPKRLLEDWMIKDVSTPLFEAGMNERQIREVLDAERIDRTRALIRELLSHRLGEEKAGEYLIQFTELGTGLYAIQLQQGTEATPFDLHIAISPNWTLYEISNSLGGLTAIESIDTLCETIDARIGENGDWGTILVQHQDELRQLYLYGVRRLSEARTIAGEDFVYHDYLSPDQWVLRLARNQILHIFPWLAEGNIPGVTLLPMHNGTDGEVSHFDVFYNGQPMGLRITDEGLLGFDRGNRGWREMTVPTDIQHIVSDMTQDALVPTNEMVNTAHMQALSTLRRELALEQATHDRMQNPETIHLPNIPDLIANRLKQAVFTELAGANPNITLEDITVRTVHNRQGFQYVELFARRNGRNERIARVSPTGELQTGWGMLQNATRFADAIRDIRRGIAEHISMGGQLLSAGVDIQHRMAVETISNNIQVRLDGSVYVLETSEYSRITSDHQLRRFARNHRIMQGIATQQDIRIDRREEGFVDSAIYTSAALAGTMVSAGLRNIGAYENVMTVVCSTAAAFVPVGVAVIQPAMRDWEQLQPRGSKENKRRNALRRLTGAGTAFLAGLFGESFLHTVLGTDQHIDKPPQRIKPILPEDQTVHTTRSVGKPGVTIYAQETTTPPQDYVLSPTQPVLNWTENPSNEQLKTFFNQLYANSTTDSLPDWKQNLLQGWASELLNHNGWRSPTDIELWFFKQIANAQTYDDYLTAVRPSLLAYERSIWYTEAMQH